MHDGRSPWSGLGSTMVGTPVRAVLALHLLAIDSGPGDATVLNLYGARPHAFDDPATVALAVLFASHTRTLLAHAQTARRATGLAAALEHSRQIGTACGVLMTLHKVTSAQAFEMLRTASSLLNRKVRDLALEVTDTGLLPHVGVGDGAR